MPSFPSRSAMHRRHHLDIGGTAALIGSVICWGSVPVALRGLTGSIDAWTANGFRYPMAAVLFWPVLWSARRRGLLDGNVALRCLVPAALALLGQIFWALSPYYLSASAVGFFIRFAMVWSIVAAMVIFPDERNLLTSQRFHIGILLSVAGFVLLAVSNGSDDMVITSTGVVIMFVCSMFFGLYGVSIRYCLTGIDPLVSFGIVAQYVSMGTLTLMFCVGDWIRLGRMAALSWMALTVSSLLGIALGHVFMYVAVHRVGTAITSAVQSATPFATAVMAAALLQETMSLRQWAAGLTMIAGATVLLSTRHVLASGNGRMDPDSSG